MERPPIIMHTDGAASGNPGPGGFGVVLRCAGRCKEISGGFALTTNNRMELLAVITGLEAIRWENAKVEVYSDSAYVVNAVQKGWLNGWRARRWKKVKNPDLWQRYLKAAEGYDVTFHWIPGHSGYPDNERCDALAVAASNMPGLPEDEGYNIYKSQDSETML